MLNFNEQLLNQFFIKKKVEIDNDKLLRYYDTIFPSPQLFISFLSAYSREEQTFYAKKIMQRMFFCKYNSSLFTLYKNLIDLEESNLAETKDTFFMRDHSIHSINTYLLGLYLYFSFSLFNKQINSYFSSKSFHDIYSKDNETNAFLSFLNCWTLFSLNHDIGYPFEILIANDGSVKYSDKTDIIDKLNSITRIITNELSINEIVFYIGLQIIINTSKIKLIDTLSPEEVSKLQQISDLDSISFVKLENILSYNIFSYYRSAFNKDQLCYIVYDNKETKKYLWYHANNSLYQFDFITNSKQKISSELLKEPKYEFEYYYPEKFLNNVIKASLSIFDPYEKDISDAAKELLSNTTISFAGITDESSYMDFLYDIYLKIKSNLSDDLRNPSDTYYKKNIASFINYITNKIYMQLSNSSIEINYENPIIDNLTKIFSNVIDDYKSAEEQKQVVVSFLKENGTSTKFNLQPLFIRLKNQYAKVLEQYNESCFVKKEGEKITYRKHKPKLIEKICQDYGKICFDSGLIDEREKINEVMSYAPHFSAFDHGMVSCLLTLETYFKISIVNDSQSFFSFENHGIDIPNIKIFTTATYSILVHNIYSSFWDSISSKNNIKHDIIKNPFVYFCLFCDNLQIWDRPYRVNQGKIELIASTLTARDVSIITTKNKLCIQCVTLEAEKIVSNFRDSLDEYLKDASKLINLSISDK